MRWGGASSWEWDTGPLGPAPPGWSCQGKNRARGWRVPRSISEVCLGLSLAVSLGARWLPWQGNAIDILEPLTSWSVSGALAWDTCASPSVPPAALEAGTFLPQITEGRGGTGGLAPRSRSLARVRACAPDRSLPITHLDTTRAGCVLVPGWLCPPPTPQEALPPSQMR